MGFKRVVTEKQRQAGKEAKAIRIQNKGKAPNVLTALEKDEILLTMAEALGFYDPTP